MQLVLIFIHQYTTNVHTYVSMYYCKYIIHMYLLLHYIKPFYFQTRYGESINNRKQKQIYFQFFMRNESEMKNLIKNLL